MEARRQALLAFAGFAEEAAAMRLPPRCSYSLDKIRREDWYPEPS
jgi:hypothetical protein